MTPRLGELDRKIMREARKPGKGVLTDDPNSPDGPSGFYYFYKPFFGKARRVEIPNREFVPFIPPNTVDD